MALAKKCDRCGKLYDAKNRLINYQRVNGLATIDRIENNQGYSIRGYFDLCPECLESFDCWLNMKVEWVYAMKDDGIHIGKEYKEDHDDSGRTES